MAKASDSRIQTMCNIQRRYMSTVCHSRSTSTPEAPTHGSTLHPWELPYLRTSYRLAITRRHLTGTSTTADIRLNIDLHIAYRDQTVSTGPIVLANVTFGPYTVYNQAIMLSINSSADAGTSSNGLIGLAGYIPDGSSIYTSLMNTSFAENGVPIVYNIFEHSPGLPNYMTFLLSRSSGGLTNGGLLTVSEVLSNLKDILKAPLLDSISPINWQTVLDGVYLNGKRLLGGKQYGNSTASPGTTWRRPALLDTGTTRIVAPLSDVEEFYKHIPGASRLQAEDGIALYRVPCETRLNVTLSLSGQLFPLHPIDLVNVAFDDIKDGFICVGTIYHGGDIPMWVLGDSFLHNVYALYGYGTPNTSELKAQSPYMQLLSLTNPARAWEEFETLLFDELLYSADSLVSALAGNATSTTGLAVYTGTTPSVSLIEASVTATAISQPVVTEIGHR
ncbi:aspartic peptidase domain-containing protein [Cubamyces menziesii]|nr:aspartic peptidase domain-containing protein [Cubamyces menziesii]